MDRAALDCAIAFGISCGGYCPKGRLAEDGQIAAHYPMTEASRPDYELRTQLNVEHSDATIIIYFDALMGGTELTQQCCRRLKKPYLLVNADVNSVDQAVLDIQRFLINNDIHCINIAGPRASEQPVAYTYTRMLLFRVWSL